MKWKEDAANIVSQFCCLSFQEQIVFFVFWWQLAGVGSQSGGVGEHLLSGIEMLGPLQSVQCPAGKWIKTDSFHYFRRGNILINNFHKTSARLFRKLPHISIHWSTPVTRTIYQYLGGLCTPPGLYIAWRCLCLELSTRISEIFKNVLAIPKIMNQYSQQAFYQQPGTTIYTKYPVP